MGNKLLKMFKESWWNFRGSFFDIFYFSLSRESTEESSGDYSHHFVIYMLNNYDIDENKKI